MPDTAHPRGNFSRGPTSGDGHGSRIFAKFTTLKTRAYSFVEFGRSVPASSANCTRLSCPGHYLKKGRRAVPRKQGNRRLAPVDSIGRLRRPLRYQRRRPCTPPRRRWRKESECDSRRRRRIAEFFSLSTSNTAYLFEKDCPKIVMEQI